MRRIFFLFLAFLVALGLAFYWATRPLPVLKITTWSGEYGRAQRSALIEPYRGIAHVDTQPNEWDGDLSELRRAVESRNYKGDVIDFELPKAVEACREGLLEKLDSRTLPRAADGTAAFKDFVAGALGPCWVGSVIYSQVILYAKDKSARAAPSSLGDFFDEARFPGTRALRAGAKYNLEMALLADGVRPEDIYKTLESAQGLARAFAKLDTLRPHLIWWHGAGEPAKLLAQGQAAFSTALSGEVFAARASPLGVIWDRQLYEFDVFGVPKGDPRKLSAMAFIRFATGAKRLARVADWTGLGPARRSAWPLVAGNPALPVAMAPFLPTSHFASAFAVDDAWWLVHGSAIEARFDAWMDRSH